MNYPYFIELGRKISKYISTDNFYYCIGENTYYLSRGYPSWDDHYCITVFPSEYETQDIDNKFSFYGKDTELEVCFCMNKSFSIFELKIKNKVFYRGKNPPKYDEFLLLWKFYNRKVMAL